MSQVSENKDGGHLPSGIMQARREWNDIFKVLKGKKICQLTIPYSEREKPELKEFPSSLVL